MANFVFNIAKGRVAAWAQNVEDNSPAAAVLRLFAIDANGATDDTMGDTDTMSALFATLANEVTNTNYANIVMDETDITITVDDTNNWVDVIVTDQTWTAIAAGDTWTDVVFAYDAAGTDVDTSTVPMTSHDFAVTPDGSDITVDVPATGFFRAS